MYKIAIFSDLHANLPALKAILRKIDLIGVDRIINLGDSIAIGPHPKQCMEIIRQRNIESLIGNHEEYFLHGVSKINQPAYMKDGELEHQMWTHKQLSDDIKDYINSLPYLIEVNIESIKFNFFHSPFIKVENDFTRFFNVNKFKSDDFEQYFKEFQADVFCFGHSHDFFDIIAKNRFINPGSVGCHCDEFARFTILEIHHNLLNAHHYQTPYEKNNMISDLFKLEVPEREMISKFFFGKN